jgi:hypothetical protein
MRTPAKKSLKPRKNQSTSKGMAAVGKKGITVRFEDKEMEKLDELAERYRVTSATVLRWALRALSDYVDLNNGRIMLPLDFGQALAKKPAPRKGRGDSDRY